MTFATMGDMAQTFLLRKHNADLKTRLNTLTKELSSGEASDKTAKLSGDYRTVGSIERSLTLMDSYDRNLVESRVSAESMQVKLGHLSDSLEDLAGNLIFAYSTGSDDAYEMAGSQAKDTLESTLSILNMSYGGRALFAGTAFERAAIKDIELIEQYEADGVTETDAYQYYVTKNGQDAATPMSMLDKVAAYVNDATAPVLPGAGTLGVPTNTDDLLAKVDQWFSNVGSPGFMADAYNGATEASGPVLVGENQTIALDLTAADSEFVDAVKSLVTATMLADTSTLSSDPEERGEMVKRSAELLLDAQEGVIRRSAHLGAIEQRIETIEATNAASRTTLEFARSELLEVDPYDTATEVQSVEVRLEMLYTLTARLSRLSLANFLT